MRLDRLQAALGYTFAQRDLLRQAVTHRSHSASHNERLEFLGDGVVNCVVAALLFERFGAAREGELSRLRAKLVRQETLVEMAQALDLGAHLLLGEGEQKSGGKQRPSILADALEAIVGAVYLDAGFDRVRQFIARLYEPLLAEMLPGGASKDAKTALQEMLQARRLALPHYALRETRGEAHAQEFEIECRIPALDICTAGVGASRRAAEQAAAQRALEQLAGA